MTKAPEAERAVPSLGQAVGAEFLGTAALLAAVVGSGIMAERLSGGSAGLALLANALATAGVLYALIAALGPVSGAHFNPVVSLAMARRGDLAWRAVPGYVAAQFVGAVSGTAAAHAMFALPVFTFSTKIRAGTAQWFSEAVATFGLLAVIWIASRRNAVAVPAAVAGWIAGAYWFTASTSFANPAVTVARSLTDTFSGIRPEDVAGFALAQLAGLAAALLVLPFIEPIRRKR